MCTQSGKLPYIFLVKTGPKKCILIKNNFFYLLIINKIMYYYSLKGQQN
jgi:hypothetical protein